MPMHLKEASARKHGAPGVFQKNRPPKQFTFSHHYNATITHHNDACTNKGRVRTPTFTRYACHAP
jgi:hypothetical protein